MKLGVDFYAAGTAAWEPPLGCVVLLYCPFRNVGCPPFSQVQNSVWISGVQPWVDSLTMQTAVLERLLGEIEGGGSLSRDWWRELPLLVFIKRSLDTVRSSMFDPSNLYRIWSQIKFATR